MALTEAANAMVEAAGTLDGVRSSLGAVGGACGACHKAYRAPSS
jgi:cytochrome c556